MAIYGDATSPISSYTTTRSLTSSNTHQSVPPNPLHHHHRHHHPHQQQPRSRINQDNNFLQTSMQSAVRPKSGSARTRSRSPLLRRRRYPAPDLQVEPPLFGPPAIWQDNELTGVWSLYSTLPKPYSAFPLPTRTDRAITTQEAGFRAWLRQQQHPTPPMMSSEQVKYVAGSLSLAQLDIARRRPSQVFGFGPTWTHPFTDDSAIQYFYVIPIPEFKSRIGFGDDIPPKQCRAVGRLALMLVMLLNMYSWLTPTQPRQEVSEGFYRKQSSDPLNYIKQTRVHFFAIGYWKFFGLQQDRWETARVLNSGWQAGKSTARILVLCLGWGGGKTFKEGGEAHLSPLHWTYSAWRYLSPLAGKILDMFNSDN